MHGSGQLPAHARPTVRRACRVSCDLALLLWLVPGSRSLLLGRLHTSYARSRTFFGKLAVVTFGGAYAVLAYVASTP